MDEHYRELFFATGSPIFYLLSRLLEKQEDDVKIAWQETPAELI